MGLLLRWSLLLLLCIVAWPGTQASAQLPVLRFGLLPYAPAETLLARFQPMERYLERTLNRGVLLVSAKDYTAFTQAMLRHEYDVAFTAPHLGLLAMDRAGWVPLVHPDITVQPVIVVPADAPVTDLAALRGGTVATPDALALVTMCAEQALIQAGLMPGKDVEVEHTASHMSAITLLQRGLVDAAATVPPVLADLPPPLRGRLRELLRLPGLFSLAYLASPRLPAVEVEALRDALMTFSTAPESDRFYQSEHSRHVPLDATDLQVYARLLPRLLDRLRPEAGR